MSKLDGSEAALRSRIDDHTFRVRPDKNSAWVFAELVSTRIAIGPEFVFRKVHHQVSLAVRHNSLQREGKVRFVIVERLNECRQGG